MTREAERSKRLKNRAKLREEKTVAVDCASLLHLGRTGASGGFVPVYHQNVWG
jgi:hypothetical protein